MEMARKKLSEQIPPVKSSTSAEPLTKDKEEGVVKISIKLLSRIAEYYQFPMAMFFMDNTDAFSNAKTREELFIKKAKEFEDKLKNLVELYYS